MTEIVIPLFPDFTALDAIGPYEVLQRIPDFDITFIGHERGVVRSDNKMLGIEIDGTFEDHPRPDVLVFPGGVGTRALMHDERVLDWVRKAHETTTFTTSVCTGSLVLAAAGLLEGLTATTHWSTLDTLAEHGAIPTSDRVVEHLDRRIITAAGVSSGIDMALRLVEVLVDRTAAEACQLMIEYDPQPPFDSGSTAKASEDVVIRVIEYAQHRSSLSARSLTPRTELTTAVEQKVSPRAKLDSVVTSPSSSVPSTSTSAPSIPLTMPRSTAQITGCSVATSPNGQWLLMIRSWSLRLSACAANPWAVSASATACIADRSDRRPAVSASPVSPLAIARPYSWPTSSAICSASWWGSRSRARPSNDNNRSSLRTGKSTSLIRAASATTT